MASAVMGMGLLGLIEFAGDRCSFKKFEYNIISCPNSARIIFIYYSSIFISRDTSFRSPSRNKVVGQKQPITIFNYLKP